MNDFGRDDTTGGLGASNVTVEPERPDATDVIDGLVTFIEKRVIPIERNNHRLLDDPRAIYDENGRYGAEVVALLRQVRLESASAGYYGMFAPSSVGGSALGAVEFYSVWDTLYNRYGPGRLLPYQVVGHWTSGASFLLEELHPAIRDEIAPIIINGESVGCFAMSEPDAGSDARAMASTARPDGSDWILNGTKQWISNATYADYAFVFAATQDERDGDAPARSITCFLVPKDTAGYRIDSTIPMFGEIGGKETIISLSDVRVPASHVVGRLHHGFDLALRGVAEGRLFNVGRCVGLARWALEHATDYAKQRTAFGQTIMGYQGVSFPLAESAIEIYAAKTMGLDCAQRIARGTHNRRELAMAKAYSTEMCFRVFDRCMQVFGAMGFTNELRLVDGWHHARSLQVADGSNEILRRTIVRELVNGNISF